MIDIKNKSIKELNTLAKDIRNKILEVVSTNGGHLSSTLGAVELTIGMHYVFDSPKDPFIFDVSHQIYPHKLITGRWEEFSTLRQFNGISGFSKPSESEHDYFIAGHSSTSISLAVGAAKAIKLKNEDRVPIVMIGDGSMSAGLVYEALNELGDLKLPVVIILNDNEMSIAKPIGAISKYLSKILAGKFYQNIRKKVDKFIRESLPKGSTYIAKRVEESIKLITPGILFEEMGIDYIGPIDGHNLKEIIETLTLAKELKKPVIIHAKTIKGKGYQIAEGHHEKWHGVSAFDIQTGNFLNKTNKRSATKIFSDKLLELSIKDEKIVGITAAMPSGTGLDRLIKHFPERFWDVAIAEQHAITSAAAMAKEGFKPVVAIYSTFLQRGYDQIIHDVAIMDLNVTFAIDRAGIVGNDGETHQGAFDISYLRVIPNLVLLAPRCEKSFELALEFAINLNKPTAIRYPRGSFDDIEFNVSKYQLGKGEILQKGSSDIVFIGYGMGVSKAIKVAKLLNKDITIIDLRFVKPIDEELLLSLVDKSNWYVFSDSAKLGGVGSAILEVLSKHNILNIRLKTFEYDDKFIPHGNTKEVEEYLQLTPKQIANTFALKI